MRLDAPRTSPIPDDEESPRPESPYRGGPRSTRHENIWGPKIASGKSVQKTNTERSTRDHLEGAGKKLMKGRHMTKIFADTDREDVLDDRTVFKTKTEYYQYKILRKVNAVHKEIFSQFKNEFRNYFERFL